MFFKTWQQNESGHERTTGAARDGQPVPKRRIANRDIRAAP
jgi:hypothetical protein